MQRACQAKVKIDEKNENVVLHAKQIWKPHSTTRTSIIFCGESHGINASIAQSVKIIEIQRNEEIMPDHVVKTWKSCFSVGISHRLCNNTLQTAHSLRPAFQWACHSRCRFIIYGFLNFEVAPWDWWNTWSPMQTNTKTTVEDTHQHHFLWWITWVQCQHRTICENCRNSKKWRDHARPCRQNMKIVFFSRYITSFV